MSAAEILEQIRRLPPAEQQEVAEKVIEEYGDFADELTPEQAAELERRAEEFHKNPQDGVPWEAVRDDVRKRFDLREGIVVSPEVASSEANLIDHRLRDHFDHPEDIVPWAEVQEKLDVKYRE